MFTCAAFTHAQCILIINSIYSPIFLLANCALFISSVLNAPCQSTAMASSWLPSPWKSRRGRRVDPERTVDDLVRKYYTTNQQSTSDILREILGSPEQASLLFSAFRRQVSLIKCRSQAFEDGQITTYDRALLKLSKNGENLTDTGALELYLTEFLGIVPISPTSQSRAILAKQLDLESVLSRGMYPRVLLFSELL